MNRPAARQDRHARQRGFTLVELLVVLVILGLIAAFAVPQVMNYLGGARSDSAKIQILRLSGILDLYRLDVGRYPTEGEGLVVLVERPDGVARWNGPYLQSADSLTDPWGRPYGFRQPGNDRAYDIFSLGADGREGGEGEDEDVAN